MNSRNMDGNARQLPGGAGYLPPLPPGAGLTRQLSIYSLTFDEIQTTLGGLGKDFGSMNMDEFIKNIWSAEEAQMMASAAGTSLPETSGSGLLRQGSLTLPRTLSQKTVDEVWRDLYRESSSVGVRGQGPAVVDLQPPQRQPTLGEITLEEFLVKAGVVREENATLGGPITAGGNSSSSNTNNMLYGDTTGTNPASNTGIFLGFNPTSRSNGGAVLPVPIQSNSVTDIAGNEVWPSYTPSFQLVNNNELGKHQGMQGGGVVGLGDSIMNNRIASGGVGLGTSGVTVATAPSPTNPLSSDRFVENNRDLSSLSPIPYAFDRVSNKRGSAKEKAVERRQKRMIKNRESAARSRARKQAYTVELEEEVAKLKEQNQQLEKKQEILEVEKNQVLELINQQSGTKKRCLRRTQTGPC